MANIKSNDKSHAQDEKARVLNHAQKSKMKTLIKKALETKKTEDLNEAISCIDSSCSKGIITKNKADRLKSRLTINFNKK